MLAGGLLAGPIASLIVWFVHPQPKWRSAQQFANEFHPVQVLPYAAGFVLVGGCVGLVASLHALVSRDRRARANLALALAAAFAAIVGFNYILQMTFVPSLVSPFRGEHRVLVSALSMENPRSLGWSLEMWGYALFGAATWALSAAFATSRLERVAAATFVANGALTVAAAIVSAFDPELLTSTMGQVGISAWQALLATMAVLVMLVMRKRRLEALRTGE
jgi:hypothetical protein